LGSLNQVDQNITTAAKAFGKSHCSAVSALQSESILQTQEFFQAFAVNSSCRQIHLSSGGENVGEGILFGVEIMLDFLLQPNLT